MKDTIGPWLAGLLLLALALPVAAADWQQVREASERGEVEVFVRPVEGNPLKAFKGIVELPHPMLRVMALMGDMDAYPEWVFQCSGVDYRPKKWGKDVVRIKIKGIWPVADRDGVFRSTITQNPDTLAITIHSRDTQGVLPPQDGYIRLPELDNRFVMEPLDDGWTRITFRTFVDPGGYIPAWLANFVATRAPEYTLSNMARMLNRDRYATDSVDALPIEFPGVADMTFPSVAKRKGAPDPGGSPASKSSAEP